MVAPEPDLVAVEQQLTARQQRPRDRLADLEGADHARVAAELEAADVGE